METFTDKLSAFGQFLSKLSWTKILQLIVLISVVASTWVVYQMSDQIVNYLKRDKIESRGPVILKLSSKTTEELDSKISKSDLIVGAIVTMVDFRKNTRSIIYLRGYSTDLQQIFVRHNMASVDLPIFTQNVMQNRHIIDLINGEFSCSDYKDMPYQAYMPETQSLITTLCSASIPPYYGKFVGTVGLFLKRQPRPEEIDQLRVLATQLSIVIYDREL